MVDIRGILTECETQLEHMCRLDFDASAKHQLMSSIICTISRSSRNVNTLKQMIKSGMNIARLNFSHESHEAHAESLIAIRQAADAYSNEVGYTRHVCIALDIKGPEIRTGLMEGGIGEIELKKNDTIRLSVNKDLKDKGTREVVYIDYPQIINIVEPGIKIFINDGAIGLVVKEVAVDCLICEIELAGMLGSRKNVNLPGVPIDLPAVSEKDRYDLKFSLENNIDVIFASVRNAGAISEIRNILGVKGKDVQIIAKIESKQALQNLDDIIATADGILISRADLGIELRAEKVMLLQKALIARCNKAGKPVICGAQLLESMRYRLRPTRAEVADLANALLDGADCVMLSSESAIGHHPVECVATMATICREAESALWYRNLFNDLLAQNAAIIDATHAVAIAAVDAARKSLAAAIVVLTSSGRSAYLLARYRPRCSILAVTRCPRTARQAYLHRSVIPVLYSEPSQDDWLQEIDARIQHALFIGMKMNIVHVGDAVIVVSPWKDAVGFTNNMRVLYAFFENESFDLTSKQENKII